MEKKHEEMLNEEVEAEETQEVEVEVETEETETPVVEEVEEEMSVEAVIQDLKDQNLRLNAEFQNFRRRVEKEKKDLVAFANQRLFKELLPVMDNFDRALASMQECEDEKILQGLTMIKQSLDTFLDKENVVKIEALDQPFDHEMHFAVMTDESDNHDEDHVIEVLQEGYTVNGRVIRPSMVKVSK